MYMYLHVCLIVLADLLSTHEAVLLSDVDVVNCITLLSP